MYRSMYLQAPRDRYENVYSIVYVTDKNQTYAFSSHSQHLEILTSPLRRVDGPRELQIHACHLASPGDRHTECSGGQNPCFLMCQLCSSLIFIWLDTHSRGCHLPGLFYSIRITISWGQGKGDTASPLLVAERDFSHPVASCPTPHCCQQALGVGWPLGQRVRLLSHQQEATTLALCTLCRLTLPWCKGSPWEYGLI